MYSSSTGQQLSQLPDLDAQSCAHREPLKRKSEQLKKYGEKSSHRQYIQNTRGDDYSEPSSSSTSPSPSLSFMTINNTNTDNPAHKPRSGGRSKKPPHELLSEKQKKLNHIASEQKRRANIRIGFDQLVDIVPTLSHCHRSESLILQKSYDYIQQLLDTKTNLKDRVRELQVILGDDPDESSDEDNEYTH